MYVDFDYFTNLYPDIDEAVFNRYSFDAERIVDNQTTGVDGVRKLRLYFPVLDEDIEAVKRCICELIATMDTIYSLERKYLSDDYKQISSVSSGSESIHYSKAETSLDKAIGNREEREKLFNNIIKDYLAGCKDSNGVNLLYMGAYV